MLKAKLAHRLDVALVRVFPFLPQLRVHPHVFTAFGLGTSLIGAWFFARGELRAGAVAIAIGGFFDLTDGVLARHQNRSTRVGAFLDSNFDRVVDVALPFALAMHYARSGAPQWAWLAGFVLLASVLTSYSKAHVERVLPGFGGGPGRARARTRRACSRAARRSRRDARTRPGARRRSTDDPWTQRYHRRPSVMLGAPWPS